MASSTPRRVDFPEGIPVGLRSFLINGKGRMMNLSTSGAYVATSMYLLPQARVRLQIVLREEKRWVETDAIMVWENRGTVGRRDGLPPGYGFRFIDTSKEAQDAIDSLLNGASASGVPSASSTEQTVALSARAPSPPPAPKATPSIQSVELLDDVPEGPPFPLRAATVGRKVPSDAQGIFVLSYDRTQETRVGRGDEDLRRTIASFEGTYAYFYFELIDSPDERYFRECELFHRLGGDRGQLDNTEHPSQPSGIEIDCPVCVAAKTR